MAQRRRLVADIARQRISRLFELALEIYKTDLDLADRYVELARKISMRARVRIPRRYRLLYCKGCGGILIPGVTARVRVRSLREKHIVIKCLRCGRFIRHPIQLR